MVFLSKLIATLVWLVIGLVLWIPLLARSVTALTFIYLRAAIERTPAPSFSGHNRAVVRFYSDGFERIWSEDTLDSIDIEEKEENWAAFFGAIFTAVVFWSPLFLLFNFTSVFTDGIDSSIRNGKIVQDYKNAETPIRIGTDCKFFRGCANSMKNGSIQVQRFIKTEESMFNDNQAILQVRFCTNRNFDQQNKVLVIYFVDSEGDIVRWNYEDVGNVLPGSCKTFEFEMDENSSATLGDVSPRHGTYYIKFDDVNYEIIV
jgi:hypothetical protein